RQILEDAGFTVADGKVTKDGRPLRIRFLTNSTYSTGAEYIAGEWRKLGIDVEHRSLEPATYGEETLAGNFDAQVMETTQVWPSAGSKLNRVTGPPLPRGFNFAYIGVDDSVLNDAASEGLSTVGEAACPSFDTVQERMIEESYLMPLAATVSDSFGT